LVVSFLFIIFEETNKINDMDFSKLNDKDLCKVLEVFESVDAMKYNDVSLRTSTLKNELKTFNVFKDWLNDLSVDNVNMKTPFLRLNIICEMSERFKKIVT